MAHEVIKEFLVAIGFKVQEDQYKRQQELIAGVEKQLVANDKAAKERDAAEKARVATQTQRSAEVAANLRMVSVAVAGFATVAASAMVAVANAIKNSIGEFDRLAYVSGRTGASVNNIKAIGYAFSQTGSSAEAAVQALESFAKARRANPGVDAMLRSYGVNTKGDTSEVLANSLDAIIKRHPQYTSQQIAGLFGISAEEVDHWIRYRKEIAQFDKQYKDLQRTFGVDGGDMARASTAISRALGEWSAVVEVLRDKLVSLFLPAIESVAKALSELIKHLTNEENVTAFVAYFDKPLAALKELVRWVGVLYDQFVRLFEYVRNSPLGKIIGAVNPGFIRDRVIDFLAPGGAQASEAPGGGGGGQGGGAPADDRNWWQRKMPKILGGKDAPGSDADLTPKPGSKADIRGKTFDSKAPGVMQRFMDDFGLSKDEASIILGNLGHESAGFTAFEEGGNGPGRGWAQWTDPGRKRRFFEYAKRNNLDPKSDEANYGFLKWELENTHSRSIDRLKRAKTYKDKMYAFEEDFEGAGIKNYDSRFRYAQRARDAYDKSQAPKPPTSRAQPNSGVSTAPNFNVDDALRSQPMGSVSSNSDNSRTVSQNNPVTVNVQGASDPQATGTAVARAMGQVNDMSLRNVQTAIR